jgi:signal transduction histidine kinase
MLLLATFRQQQTQALIMALGILSAFALVLLANTAGYMLPFDHLPQLGILSLSFVAFVVFFALWKYGYPVSIGNVMDELRKAKKIGESLKGLLVSGYEEDAIFQNICDSAQEISESIYVFVALFGVDGDSYVVRGLSQASETLMDTVFGRLPLAPGTRREITPTSAFRRLLDSGKPHQCNSIHDFFGGRIDEEKARQLDRTAEIRQIVSYPILLHEKVQGAIVLFRREVAESLDIYGVFAIQCSLALLTSAHIRELEEKRKLEEMLHHSQKMDAIGQLAGGMAHDFNNMLAGISGYATIIKRSFARDNPRLGTYIDAIIAASDRSAELITKLLAFARKGKYQMIAVDVHKAVGDVVEILQRTIDKRIRIIRNLSADPHTVLGDPAQVENIFLNLAVNARDAMSHGGTLTFETRVESIASDHPLATTTGLQPGEYLLATVADTGGGMDEETLSHIFEPFYTTKEVGKGTGLGLASVYGSVRNHHGHIEVHSAPGTGTTFRIALPLLRGDRIPEATATKPAVNFKEGKGHILIIDDEMMIRELCREILSHHGYDVTTAAGPHEALVFYRDHYHEVDAVLLDMIMPQMSGPDCLEVLRHTNNQVKVVLMTGHDFTDKTSTIISNGISGFLQKPFKEAELLEILAETLC